MSHKKVLYTIAAASFALTATASNDKAMPYEPTITPTTVSVDIYGGGAFSSGQFSSNSQVYANEAKSGYAFGADLGIEPFSHIGFTAGWLQQPKVRTTLTGSAQQTNIKSWSAYTAVKFDLRVPFTTNDTFYLEAGAAYNHNKIQSNNDSFSNVTPVIITGIKDQINSNLFWGVKYMYVPKAMSADRGYKAPSANNVMLTLGLDTSYL